MALLLLALSVSVTTALCTIGFSALHELFLGKPPVPEADNESEGSNARSLRENRSLGHRTSAELDAEAWLREIDAMERF